MRSSSAIFTRRISFITSSGVKRSRTAASISFAMSPADFDAVMARGFTMMSRCLGSRTRMSERNSLCANSARSALSKCPCCEKSSNSVSLPPCEETNFSRFLIAPSGSGDLAAPSRIRGSTAAKLLLLRFEA